MCRLSNKILQGVKSPACLHHQKRKADMNEELQIEVLTNEIGGWGFTYETLRNSLRGFKGNKIRVPLNTFGGDAFAALAIHNTLLGNKAIVEINIVAYAASAGTMIAACGDYVTMADNGFYMLHNPAGGTYGEAENLDTTAKLLRDLTDSMVAMYYDRIERSAKAKGEAPKLTKDQIRQMMADTTWLPAAKALEYGFVDALTKGAKFEASADVQFFANVPEVLKANSQTATPPIVASQIPYTKMEDLKILAQDLGLTANANLLDIRNAMFEQRKAQNALAEENKELKAKVQGFEAKAKEAQTTEAAELIEAAVTAGKITLTDKPTWEENFQSNHETSKKLLEKMGRVVKLSEVPQTGANGGSATDGTFKYQGKTFSELSRENPKALENLKLTDAATFNSLYKAEFGKDWMVNPTAKPIA